MNGPLLSAGTDMPRTRSALVKTYCDSCDTYKVPYDPSIISVLSTEWNTLYKPLRDISQVIPICDVLAHPDATFIHTVHLGCKIWMHSKRDGDWICRLLRNVLEINNTIRHLNLAQLGISTMGMEELFIGLRKNTGLETLDLKRNYFHDGGGTVLCDFVKSQTSALRWIDVSYCSLGSFAIHKVVHIVRERSALCDGSSSSEELLSCREELTMDKYPMEGDRDEPVPMIEIGTRGNFEMEEIYNSISHGIGLFLTLIGAYWVLSDVIAQPHNPHKIRKEVALTVYFFSLLLMYTSSTLMHGFFLLKRVEYVFQILDHLGIYFLIAGTYTPVLAINMMHTTSGFVFLIMEWSLCGVGTLMYVVGKELDIPGKNMAFDLIELCFYLLMGWLAVCDVSMLMLCLDSYSRSMIVAGGCVYTVGVIFFISGKYIPICHVIWHFFVLVASILHFFAIKDMVAHDIPATCPQS